jgi:hypothetical protein
MFRGPPIHFWIKPNNVKTCFRKCLFLFGKIIFKWRKTVIKKCLDYFSRDNL